MSINAELNRVADDLDSFIKDMMEDGNDASALWLEERSRTLRRLSAQQREPVVRVKELEWSKEPPYHIARMRIGFYSVEYIESDDGGYFDLRGSLSRGSYRTLNAAKSAAQADYEQRIMAAIEITRSDHTSKSTAARTDAGKTGVTAGETATTSDGGSPGPSPLAVEQTSSDPASGRSQPSPDVSVDELAQFLRDADRQTGNCTDDDTAASYMDLARALLARYRIERLDRLASGRR